jgi:hypothetical protein
LKHPIVLYRDPKGKYWLLDGRNRLAAMERVGIRIELCAGPQPPFVHFPDDDVEGPQGSTAYVDDRVDPHAYVISTNIQRRHLNTEQKRDLIAKLLKRDPTQSNREIGETVKADDKTVGTVRRKLEASAEIPHIDHPKTTNRNKAARKSGNKTTRHRRSAGSAAAVTGLQLADLWHRASPAERIRFIDQIGSQALAAHIPAAWEKTLGPRPAQALPSPPQMPAMPTDTEDDPDIPAPFRRVH